MNAFEKTLSFSDKLRKPAHKIIGWCFAKGFIAKVQVQSLNDMALDQRAGIDSKVVFEQSQVSFSIQEKYRTRQYKRQIHRRLRRYKNKQNPRPEFARTIRHNKAQLNRR